MTKVTAGITMSVDGYIAGPDDGPEKGLGEGGERLHYWVFGGPWTYDSEARGEATGEDAAWLEQAISRLGAVVGGRWTYEAARHWGDENPWGFRSSSSRTGPTRSPKAARSSSWTASRRQSRVRERPPGDKDVSVMGGADVIRQALEAGLVEELTIIVAPVVLGGGKRLFEGFTTPLDLEHIGVRQSPFATFIDYRVKSRS